MLDISDTLGAGVTLSSLLINEVFSQVPWLLAKKPDEVDCEALSKNLLYSQNF